MANNASPLRPTLSDCLELVLDQADGLADDVLAALERLITEPDGDMLMRVLTAAAQDAIRVLLADADAVRATMGAELRRLVFHSSGKDLAESQDERFDALRFFDIREIEVHIELSLARQEVIRGTDDVLPAFDALVSALMGWSTVQAVLNPLKPETFVRALVETLTAWVPQEDVRMDLLRPSAIAMAVGLHQLYREACEWMRSQGVRPVDRSPIHSGDAAASRARKAQTEVERTMQTLEKLRRLLAGEPHARVELGATHDFSHTVPGALVALQDLKMVEPMLQRLAERSVRQLALGKPPAAAQSDAIGQNRSRDQNQQIGRMLGEEVVGLMLDQLANDERLLPPVRMQLRALEPALLQLARSDPRFFIDRHHAARQLLDRVVQRSLAYQGEDEEAIADFTACVSDAVNALSRSAGDSSAYTQALKDLQTAWDARDATRQARREQETLAREHAQQRLVLAQRFSQAMVERLRSTALPELVASFLRGPWAQVLAESHLLSQGKQEDPRGYLALVDDLVWSVQLPLVRLDYARLVRMLPRLLARLHAGLLVIDYPPEPITLFLDELSALHDKILEDHRRAMATARASGYDARPSARYADGDPNEWLPSEQDVGAMVELMLGGEWVQTRLTWIGRNRNLFMFVSGSGLSHAMSRRTMDRLQAQERIRVLIPSFDLLIESGVAPLGADENVDATTP
ncbi:MAG: DUF1631 family protein [Burkholderiaceae bacterium]